MTLKKHILLIVGFVIAFNGYGQSRAIKKVIKKQYNNFSYVKTSEILGEVAAKGYKSVDLFQKLGNSFYFNNKMEDAAKWYGELMALEGTDLATEKIDPEYYYRYSQALKSIQKYDEADQWMQKFAENKASDLRGKSFLGKRDYLKSIEEKSESFIIKNMDINSAASDFGSNQYKNQLIFASSRTPGDIYKWNEQPFLELHAATKQEDGSYSNVEKFDKRINTAYHESTVSFTPDDKIMYFTRNNYTKRKLKKDLEGITRLKMYRASIQKDGSWGDVKGIHFNSDQYSVAHPTVNVRGTKLYFASDMPGTVGASDLYVVDINADGSLGTPTNLGSKINTEGQETFPYVNSKGDLYFSSNGLTGLGGLDIFMIRDFENKYEKRESFVVENVGKPINSSMDDFGYYENLGTQEGFFTSNRDGGKGDDDIYQFVVPDCLQQLEGLVIDEDTKALITGATVRLFEASGEEIGKMIVGEDAQYTFQDVPCEKEYLVRVEKENYTSDEARVMTSNNRKEVLNLDLEIKADQVEIAVGTNLREAINLNPIYFNFDKSKIRPDAEVELQKVIAVLQQYPNMKIDVRSHTDSRASKSYNDALSSRRNASTIKYIVKVGGIAANRLTGQGYGERQLSNGCSDGVRCSEDEHQQNRRSDFIIVSID